MFQKIDHMRSADAVVEQIEELILHGILRSGDRLPAERDLVAQVDVSRPVLRDALKTLEDRGLLTSRQGGGTYVADLIGTVFSDPIVDLIGRHPSANNDYLEFRKDIEGLAAAHAATRATEADRTILKRIITDMEDAYESGDRAREAELDVEFHQAVGEAAHNLILLHTLRACYRLLSNGVFFSQLKLYHHPTARETILDQHRAIAEAILSGDPDTARTASEEHIDFVRSAQAEMARQGSREEIADMRLIRDALAATAKKPKSRTRRRSQTGA
jgi:GntR family transcriptional repressor for pyruvate dehydrogenase complex